MGPGLALMKIATFRGFVLDGDLYSETLESTGPQGLNAPRLRWK